MLNLNRQEKGLLTIVYTCTALLLIIASFFDQEISQHLSSQNSIFGTLFQNFGMFPEPMVLFLSANILAFAGYRNSQSNVLKIILTAAGLILSFWAISHMVDDWLYYGYSTAANVKQDLPIATANNDTGGAVQYSALLKYGLSLPIWAVGTLLEFRWLIKQDAKAISYLIKIALIGIAFHFLSESIIDSMKETWGRFRPYEVFQETEGAHFTNWWQINGENGHRSFPSGHTLAGMSAMFFPFFISRDNIEGQKLATWIALTYGALMAVSRVRVQAHFLSDVCVSAMITFFVVFALTKVAGYRFIEDED
ncbi:phosphatase PAP2 family protein [Streptococcus dentasini]